MVTAFKFVKKAAVTIFQEFKDVKTNRRKAPLGHLLRGVFIWYRTTFIQVRNHPGSDIETNHTGVSSPWYENLASCKRGNLVHRVSLLNVSWGKRRQEGEGTGKAKNLGTRLYVCCRSVRFPFLLILTFWKMVDWPIVDETIFVSVCTFYRSKYTI